MTTNDPNDGKPYYDAGGKRIILQEAEDLLAVNRQQLLTKLPSFKALEFGHQVGAGHDLFLRSQFDEATIKLLAESGLVRPVYRHSDSLLVLLPEIRIECENDRNLESVITELANDPGVKITRLPGRLTLACSDDRVHETLRLANHIFETHPGLSVTPRFLRVTDRPKVML